MRALVPLLPGALMAEKAMAKAEKIANEIIIAYVFPAESLSYMSGTKAVYYVRAGTYAMEHLKRNSTKRTKTVFLYGEAVIEIMRLAEKEGVDVIIAQSWHGSERRTFQALNDQQVPLITIFEEQPIDPAPLRRQMAGGSVDMPSSQKEIEERLIELRKARGAPKPRYAYEPEDWVRSLRHGKALSIYFRLGFINESDYFEKLLEDYSRNKLTKEFFDERMKKILKMYFILLKYKDVQPLKEEWWAERNSFEKEKIQAQCVRDAVEKLEAEGYLENSGRVLLSSYLGHHLRMKSQAILAYFEQNLLDYEERISKYNLFDVLGLLGHAYVVSKRYAREHGFCRNCDLTIGHCTLKKGYASWMSAEEKHKTSPELSSFSSEHEQ